MNLRVKYQYKYPAKVPDRPKLRITYDRIKEGTIAIRETVTEEIEITPSYVSEEGAWLFESPYKSLLSQSGAEHLPDENLVLEFLFQEGGGDVLHDSSRYGNNGKIYGASWVDLGNGRYGLSFDGIDDYVRVAYNSLFDLTNEGTVLLLIYPLQSTQRHDMYGRYNNSQHRFSTVGKGTGGSLRFHWYANGSVYYVDSIGGIELNRWNFAGVMWKYNSSGYKIWFVFDDQIEEHYVSSPQMDVITNDVTIGYTFEWFKGIITLACIYNRVLTESEIKSRYEQLKQIFPELG